MPVPVAVWPGPSDPPGLSATELDNVAVYPIAHASFGTVTVHVTEYVPFDARQDATPVMSVWKAAAVPGATATAAAAASTGRASFNRAARRAVGRVWRFMTRRPYRSPSRGPRMPAVVGVHTGLCQVRRLVHPMVRSTGGAVYRRRMTDHDLAADLRRVAHRAFANLDGRTTDMSDEIWYEPTVNYADQTRHDRELDVLFRRTPLLLGLSCDWPSAGSFRTFDHLPDVPLLIVRGNDGVLRAFLNVCRHRGRRDSCTTPTGCSSG